MHSFIAKTLTLLFAGIALFHGNELHGSDWVFAESAPGRHRGPVSAIVHREEMIVSAGEDGFLEVWNTRTASGLAGGHAGQRFQISPHRITAMAGRPDRDEVCVVESDGQGLYRISAWNYRDRRNIFTVHFREPISYVSYSARGSFIIAAGTGRAGILTIDAATGETLLSIPSLAGPVGIAVTGRSERNMVVYQPSGALIYWDLETSRQTNRFNVPQNLLSPVLFGNSRFLAGVNAQGLAVVNAISGELLGRDGAIPGNALLFPAGDELLCLVQRPGSPAGLHRYTIDQSGRLASLGHSAVSGLDRDERFTAFSFNGMAALGGANGALATAGMDGRAQLLRAAGQIHITDAAVSGSTIAFLAENGMQGFIPLNYSQLTARTAIRTEPIDRAFNRITAFAGENGDDGQFIFWQDINRQTLPVIRSSIPGSQPRELDGVTLRTPLRSTASFGGRVQFLDSLGNITVVSPFSDSAFTFFSVGLMDSAFAGHDQLIIGRSVVAGNTPFLMLNIDTGETVPLPHPSQAGVKLYRGSSGSIFAVTVSPQADGGFITSIFGFDPEDSINSRRLVDYPGEDTQFSLAETPGGFAATIGGEGAAIYTSGGMLRLDRTPGFPLRLADGGSFLINLDKDGNIAWHDSRSGRLLAVFRLHPDRWSLQTERGTISGPSH